MQQNNLEQVKKNIFTSPNLRCTPFVSFVGISFTSNKQFHSTLRWEIHLKFSTRFNNLDTLSARSTGVWDSFPTVFKCDVDLIYQFYLM